jgi:hypothetical protein
MPKLTKAESSRINGAKSRGPKTPQGRANSSMNATTHGLTAKTLILQNESQADFLEMLNAYIDVLRPANAMELETVSDIAAARWRLRRMWRYQTAILDLEVEKQAQEFEKRGETLDENMRDAKAFLAVTDNSKGYDIALRHDIHLTRAYRKAMDELRCLRTENIRKKNAVLQNEPKDLGLSPLNRTKDAAEISTEPKEPTASQHPPL